MPDTEVGKIALALTLEKKQFNDDINNVAKHAENTLSSSFVKVGKVLAGALAFGKLVQFGKDCIKLGSDLAEVQNVVDVTFGGMSAKVDEFAKRAIDDFGLSRTVAKQYMGQLGSMAKAFGFSTAQAYDMAEALTGLSGDVASFYNLSTDEAFTKLKAVFTGETESLKSLGVVMTQAALDQFALANGYGKTTSAMSEQEKVALRLAFVQNALTGASGDFARTASGWANSTRVLSLRFSELKATIGQGFINIFTPMITLINTLLAKLQTLANYFLAFTQLLSGGKSNGTVAGSAEIADNLGSAAQAMGGLDAGLGGAAKGAKATAYSLKKAKGFLAGFDNLNVLKNNADAGSGGSGGAGGGGGAGSGGIGLPDTSLSLDAGNPDTSGVDEFYEKVKAVFEKLKAFLSKYGSIIKSVIAGIIAGFAAFQIVMNWAKISTLFSQGIGAIVGGLTWLKTAFEVLWLSITNGEGILVGLQAVFGTAAGTALFVAGIVAAVTAALVYLYDTSASFRALVQEALDSLFSILTNLYTGVIQPLFGFLGDVFMTVLWPIGEFLAKVFVKTIEVVASVLLSLWNNLLAPIANFLVGVLKVALKGIIDIWDAWKPTIKAVMDALNKAWDDCLAPLVDWIKDAVLGVLDEVGKVIGELGDFILTVFGGIIDFFVGIFTADMDKSWSGIRQIFEAFSSFLGGNFEIDWDTAFQTFSSIMTAFWQTLSDVWEDIKDIFNGVVKFITGVFTGDWSSAWDGVVQALGGTFEGIIDVVKAPLNGVIGLVNGAIGSLNKLSVTIPNWVPEVGGRSFGVNIPKIPLLAEGGYVKANQPRLAVVGDNRRYGEIVSPENKMYDVMSKAIRDHAGTGNREDYVIIINLLYEIIDILRNLDLDIDVDRFIRILDKRKEQLELMKG